MTQNVFNEEDDRRAAQYERERKSEETIKRWAYEQLDQHEARARDATLHRELYWEGYKDALECLLLTMYGEKHTYTRREINRFIEQHRPKEA